MSPLAFPDHIKTHCRENLENWFSINKNIPELHEGEVAQIKRLIDYLEVVETPHKRADNEKSKLHHDFKSFYQQYDKRRGHSLKDTFPKILSEWVESITIDDTIPIVNLGTGEIINHDS
tara:strand:+ start:58 stop:414 length:357 start_codon:yes stop_codon:yes gene_type:complete